MGVRRLPWVVAGSLVTVLAGWALWFAIGWLRYGHAATLEPRDPLVDQFMPRYDAAERHEILVHAAASCTYDAALAVDIERAPVVHAIFAARGLFLREADTAAAHLRLGDLEAIGWGRLAEVPGREIVFGAVTQPWKGHVTFRPLAPTAFAAFDSAGYVKIIWTIAAESLGPERSRFRTETRVLATDRTARAPFRRYWSMFSPGIVLIRWQALRLVRADAEREAAAP